MSSHDTAALGAHQEEPSADVVPGGRDEPAELVLGRLEARMAESGLRAHIYLTEHSVVEFATRRKRTDRPLERNVGPQPIRRVLAELLSPETEPRSWLTRLHAGARTGLSGRDHRLPDAGGGRGRGRGRFDVRGGDRQAAEARDRALRSRHLVNGGLGDAQRDLRHPYQVKVVGPEFVPGETRDGARRMRLLGPVRAPTQADGRLGPAARATVPPRRRGCCTGRSSPRDRRTRRAARRCASSAARSATAVSIPWDCPRSPRTAASTPKPA